MPIIEETIAFIRKAHAGQLTKIGEPYWTHPVAVMDLLPPEATEDERLAALLHDVIEDTRTTADDLRRMGYSERTIALVESLTRPEGSNRPSYMDWINGIAASGDRGLMRIKLADNEHNSDQVRVAKLTPELQQRNRRYQKSMIVLRDALRDGRD